MTNSNKDAAAITYSAADHLESVLPGASAAAAIAAAPPAATLKRGLKSRHIQMIALGGTIGTGLFIGSGSSLSRAGPIGALIAYIWVGTMVYSVMLSLGEMATYLPVQGAMTTYATRFVDPSLGFAFGWMYWFSWAITFAIELTAIALVIQYWKHDLSVAIFIPLFWTLVTLANFLPVKIYGELEFWAASIKVIAIIAFFLLAICIDAGVGTQGYLGFEYWVHPGSLASYLVSGATGRFVGFSSVLIQAGFAYQGTELIGVAVAEVQNPGRNVPSAIKKTFFRIAIFYVGSVFFIGLLIPYDNKRLLSTATDARASPFVIAIELAGIKVLPGLINAVLLLVVLSTANSTVYSGSRILVGLATAQMAPDIVARTNRHGIPYVAVLATASVGLLAFLNISSTTGTVFNWLVDVAGVAGFICWCTISLSHIRFMRAMSYQDVPRDSLPYVAQFQPWFTYYGFAFMVLITLTQGFSCFISWSISTFFANYISTIFFAFLYFTHKFIHKTSIVALGRVDLATGSRTNLTANPFPTINLHRTWPQKIIAALT